MLYIVGFGPGHHEGMTIEAENAIKESSLVVGYTVYSELIAQFFPDKEFYSTPMKQEKERVLYALDKAQTMNVSIICSGDSVVYAMAGLAYELAEKYYPDTVMEVIAGVTAALSGSAVLGAPLTADFAVISLSDLLTPWEKIEKRIRCASEADLVIALYNPSSKKRIGYLKTVCEIMLEYKSPETVCGYVKNIGREGQSYMILTLAELKNETVDMFTTVFIGNSDTRIVLDKMVTPRGYRE